MVEYSREKHFCITCGKETYINTCGFCVVCWDTYAHLRVNKGVKDEGKSREV